MEALLQRAVSDIEKAREFPGNSCSARLSFEEPLEDLLCHVNVLVFIKVFASYSPVDSLYD